MKIRDLKNIMKQINEPNEFRMVPFKLDHKLYWIWYVKNARLKPIYSPIFDFRKPESRWDVFYNGQYIHKKDFIYEHRGNDFYIKFIRANFPPNDGFGDPFTMVSSDEIWIKGDLEEVK